MINFILDKIQLRNVRKYGDDMMEMDFPLNNLTVFTGKVGAGKSTILKAVSMALYGEDGGAKNQKLAIDDLLNEKNKKNLEIHLYFHSTVEGQSGETKYEIHLFHKHTKYNNKLVFVKDGRDISCSSKTETYELIEKTLIPSSVYHNTYYFTQNCKNFFTSLTNSEQKDIFNSILDLSEYGSYYENTRKSLDEENIKKVKLDSELIAQTGNVQLVSDFIKQKQTEFNDKIDRSRQRVLELEVLVTNARSEIDRVNEQMDQYRNVNEEIRSLEMKNQEQRLKTESECEKLDQESISLDNDLNNVQKPALINKYKILNDEHTKDIVIEIEKLNSDKSNISIRSDKELSEIDSKYLEIISKKKEEYNSVLNVKNDEIRKITLELAKLDSKYSQVIYNFTSKVQEEIKSIREKLSPLTAEKVKIESSLQYLRQQYTEYTSQYKSDKEDLDKPDAICKTCGQKITNKEHILTHLKDLEICLEQVKSDGLKLKESKEKIEKEINDYNNKIKELEDSIIQKQRELNIEKIEASKSLLEKNEMLASDVNKISENNQVDINNINLQKKEEKDNVMKKYMEETQKIDQKLRELQDKKVSIYESYKRLLNEEWRNIQQKILDKQNQLKKKQEEFRNAYSEYLRTTYNEQYNSLMTQKSELDELRKQESDCVSLLEKYKNEIIYINDEEKNSRVAYDKAVIEYQEKLNSEIEKEKKLKTSISNCARKIKILEFWKVAFSDAGIKSMLIDSALPHMNECVSTELERTAPGKFTVSFDTLSETKSGKIKDKFSIRILNNETQSTGHKKLSGGEMRIVDLCCMSALRSLAEKLYNKRFFHIFYDEILDSLDDECKQQFCANVKIQSTTGRNVTLITHDLPEDVDPDRVFPF